MKISMMHHRDDNVKIDINQFETMLSTTSFLIKINKSISVINLIRKVD